MDEENKHTGEKKDKAVPKREAEIAKIIIDRNMCIGAVSCMAIAPGVFELDEEKKAVVGDQNGAHRDIIILAAKSCPTRAILIIDEDGNQIYP